MQIEDKEIQEIKNRVSLFEKSESELTSAGPSRASVIVNYQGGIQEHYYNDVTLLLSTIEGLKQENSKLNIMTDECHVALEKAATVIEGLKVEVERLTQLYERERYFTDTPNNVVMNTLRQHVERYRTALEKMDDRKNPMLPRSVMARIAKEALGNHT